MEAVVNLVESAAVIVLGVLFLTLIGGRLERMPLVRGLAIGLVFGAVGIVDFPTNAVIVSEAGKDNSGHPVAAS